MGLNLEARRFPARAFSTSIPHIFRCTRIQQQLYGLHMSVAGSMVQRACTIHVLVALDKPWVPLPGLGLHLSLKVGKNMAMREP